LCFSIASSRKTKKAASFACSPFHNLYGVQGSLSQAPIRKVLQEQQTQNHSTTLPALPQALSLPRPYSALKNGEAFFAANVFVLDSFFAFFKAFFFFPISFSSCPLGRLPQTYRQLTTS
jgi:hypothetical protein